MSEDDTSQDGIAPDAVPMAEVTASVAGTVVFVVAAVLGAAWPDELAVVAVAVDLVLFFVGLVLFGLSFVLAASRSRHDEMSVAGLWFLAGDVAPTRVRRLLLGALGVQVVVGVATASVRPFSGLAFGVLVPTYGLALVGMWAARHGRFPRRAR